VWRTDRLFVLLACILDGLSEFLPLQIENLNHCYKSLQWHVGFSDKSWGLILVTRNKLLISED